MSFTLELGWWIAPTAITIAAFAIAAYMGRDEGGHGDYAAIGNAFVGLVVYGAALVLSLIAWLIWAIAA
ncbi:hypothetical protein RMR10_011975 [Agrobacterium rosae]|uniref:hypothetical protein n=1 Tax=Agrobacterium rosae TaxID=1972867 RepID=UPI002A10CCBC|nr:hypothetical protein [Agrobacterium rosae]MDX8313346.1 hypothetical protein [Agrobacterium rosae]